MGANCSTLYTVRNSKHIILVKKISVHLHVFNAYYFFRRRQARGYTVRVGSTTQRNGGSVIEVRQFFRHGRYRPRTLDFDYSLVQLSTSLNFTNQTQPIALSNAKYQISEGTICHVTGFGNQTI